MSATPESTIIGRMTGMVKWFNNKAGFGFITVCSENSHKGTDIFAHYSAIRDSKTQYKYLVQGEYIEFDLVTSKSGQHKYNASDICGVLGGFIMCETRKIAFDQSAQQPRDSTQERKYTVRPSTDNEFKEVRTKSRPVVDTVTAPKRTKPTGNSRQSSGFDDSKPLKNLLSRQHSEE